MLMRPLGGTSDFQNFLRGGTGHHILPCIIACRSRASSQSLFVFLASSLTLFFQSEEFIQWKPTILYFGLALLLLLWTIFGKENPLQKLIQSFSDKAGFTIEAATSRWNALSFAWIIGLLIIGTANIYVAKSFELSTWVSFKSFVLPIMLPVYLFATGALLLKSNFNEASVETKVTELEDNS